MASPFMPVWWQAPFGCIGLVCQAQQEQAPAVTLSQVAWLPYFEDGCYWRSRYAGAGHSLIAVTCVSGQMVAQTCNNTVDTRVSQPIISCMGPIIGCMVCNHHH